MQTPPFRGLASRVAARVTGSRFAGPIARVALVAAALSFLALIGRIGLAGAFGTPTPATITGLIAPAPAPEHASAPEHAPAPEHASAPASAPEHASASAPEPTPTPTPSRSPASSDDPVFLNTATATDLRRLPGIGDKRANAILALRARLGRFRAVEDLLKVKGIGRAMLKRLRPLVRIDPSLAPGDAGAPPAAAAPGDDDATYSPSALG